MKKFVLSAILGAALISTAQAGAIKLAAKGTLKTAKFAVKATKVTVKTALMKLQWQFHKISEHTIDTHITSRPLIFYFRVYFFQ